MSVLKIILITLAVLFIAIMIGVIGAGLLMIFVESDTCERFMIAVGECLLKVMETEIRIFKKLFKIK